LLGRWTATGVRQDRYPRRNIVERCFNRFKQYPAIATRYDKTATSYQAMIDLATLLVWLWGQVLVGLC
jgi:transposase